MRSIETLIVGAGVTGLAAAGALGEQADYLVLEADAEPGGYCKTVKQAGFTWDYSGHFFHFKRPEIEAWLRARMPGQRILRVEKRSFIDFAGRLIDFPFQKNIHQLPQPDFIDCLVDLFEASEAPPSEPAGSFKEMLLERFGRGICERFLFPYNEKLYACDLGALDVGAMGRFFPHADLRAIVRNMRSPDNASYNQTFTYPEGGAVEYVKALASAVPPERVALAEPLLALDLERRVARTATRELRYERVLSSAPFDRLLRLAGLEPEPGVFSYNKVLVFNLGFDRKGRAGVHWIYYPDPSLIFYRVGYYDNIFEGERLSIYVEIGLSAGARVDVEAARNRVLTDLRRAGVIDQHQLVSWHSVVLDPAYVHITERSLAEHARLSERLRADGVYSIGRYGGWTYCSIEDDIVEARALVASFSS
ncbi:MAG: NAD(P)-binding protein [Sorangiineae bacterium]|nr:NAD(P)-binding protein [Polyangiaceae bacterium]MEB2324947.1 NAD(P)-binding protein [Sorangiineae bacterium]